MKTILLLTPIYPSNDSSKVSTLVVHYFTKEWVKLGHKVVVMHYAVNFPKIVYAIASICEQKLASVFGTSIRTVELQDTTYEIDGVSVNRICVQKYAPHTRYSKSQLDHALIRTVNYLDESNISPDVIVSHWVNPQLEIMCKLKQKFNVPLCYIAHDTGRDLLTIYKNTSQKMLAAIDVIGFRSDSIKRIFENNFGCKARSFQCYSGIPKRYITDSYTDKEFIEISNYIFIGNLIQRKYPAQIVEAIAKNYTANDNFCITYIGDGAEKKNILRKAQKWNIADKVKMQGYLSRDEVAICLKKQDVFIMISKNETFGLVYLEAMASGCITIASRDEGFDGIIIDGYNGFLCKAGDAVELSNIIKRIKSMSKTDLAQISHNAHMTAIKLTDEKAAQIYLDNILSV